MARARLARAALAAAAASLLATGCTSSGTADPLPTGSAPTADPKPTSNLPAFDEQAAADLFGAWRDVIHGLPPTPAAEVDIEGAGEGIVVPDSPAAATIASALQRAVDTGVLDRGNVHTEVLGLQTTGDNTKQATVCVSLDVEFTDLETGEPTQSDVSIPTDYQRVEATYQLVDGTWLLEEATGANPQNCVPPSIAQAVEANWEAFVAANVDWARHGAPGDDIGKLADLTTVEQQEAYRSRPGLEPGAHSEREGLDYDLQLYQATPARVEGNWCFDPARNPEAGLYEAGGTFTPMTDLAVRRYEEAVWELVDGAWLLARQETIRPDHPDAPENHRCF